FIYDRYGKLMAILNNNTPMWNGSYKGRVLPSNDYWFSIILENGVSKSGHFTLKR
ncbi:MAG: T9SS type B sorting domain-containing protein, partial [Oceanihabitans sp.]|nr:T9SS type B sorting domain-containing protein [Oceanihabitans sp.]